MTSIAFAYNKRWLAIAADSAGSLPNWKVFSANKIYRLSNTQPIWIATYWSSEVWWIPCEVIAKLFRKEWNTFVSIEECLNAFLGYIGSFEKINYTPTDIIILLVKDIVEQYESAKWKTDEEKIQNVISLFKSIGKGDYLPQEKINEFLKIYDDSGDVNKFLGNYTSIKWQIRSALEVCLKIKLPIWWLAWFILFWFWEDDIFPSMHSIQFLSKVEWQLYYIETENNKDYIWWSWIYPFAQRDAIDTLLYWISPSFENYVLTNLPPKSTINTWKKKRENILKMLETINHLSLDELWSMVETFVNLQSFKTRMKDVNETVWWPTDVAVISKWDWFIWLKRKHYFDKDMNLHFVNNYQ